LNQLIIYIEIHKERTFSFQNNVLSHIKTIHPRNTLLDLDNFSSPELFKHIIEACKAQKKIILILNSKEKDNTLGQVLNLINKLFRLKTTNVDSYLLGENQTAEKLLKRTNTTHKHSTQSFMRLLQL
jgi:hypothetical protein